MPPRRAAQAKQLMKLYVQTQNSRRSRQQKRVKRLKTWLYRQRTPSSDSLEPLSDIASDGSSGSLSSLPHSDSESEGASADSETDGMSVWSDPSTTIDTDTTSSTANISSDSLESEPGRRQATSAPTSTSGDSNFSLLEDLSLQFDELEEDENLEEGTNSLCRLRQWVQDQINIMYLERYLVPRDPIPRGPSYLNHILSVLKTERPDLFRQSLRVTPATFDALVNKIATDIVFFSNANNGQMPVEEQLAITLYRFGHDGNAASLQAVANWAGVGKGTVTVVTRRVMTALPFCRGTCILLPCG